MVGHQVIEVFVGQLVGLIVLELPEKTCRRLQLWEAGASIDFEGCRERLDFDPVLDVVGITLDQFHPDSLYHLLCLLHIDEQLCVLFDNVKDLAIEVMMQLNKSLSILVVEDIRFTILLAIC